MSSFASADANQHQRVYERTPHVLNIVCDSDHLPDAITKSDIFEGGVAFVLHNVISLNEIAQLKESAVQFGMSDSGYPSSYRICKRVSAMADSFGKVLFNRIKPYLDIVTVDRSRGEMQIDGMSSKLSSGIWTPVGLNPCFRIVKYEPGGFFYPHYDGGFDIDIDCSSVKTFMLYLNDDFDGGATSFYSEDGDTEMYMRPLERDVIYKYVPKAGDCVIFNHWLMHDGGVVRSNEKWICRSEVMYQRTNLAPTVAAAPVPDHVETLAVGVDEK